MSPKFEITYHEASIPIFVHEVKGKTLYYANVEGKPIVFTRARAIDKTIFWTSIPEGQLDLAMELGKLIDQTIN